jgi:hypothetical protein
VKNLSAVTLAVLLVVAVASLSCGGGNHLVSIAVNPNPAPSTPWKHSIQSQRNLQRRNHSRKVGSTEQLQVPSDAGLLFGLHGAREQCLQ